MNIHALFDWAYDPTVQLFQRSNQMRIAQNESKSVEL